MRLQPPSKEGKVGGKIAQFFCRIREEVAVRKFLALVEFLFFAIIFISCSTAFTAGSVSLKLRFSELESHSNKVYGSAV